MPSANLPSPLQVQLSLWWEGGHPPSPQLTALSFSTSHPLASLGSSWQERDDTAGEGESRTYAKSYSRPRLSLPFLLGLQGPLPAPAPHAPPPCHVHGRGFPVDSCQRSPRALVRSPPAHSPGLTPSRAAARVRIRFLFRAESRSPRAVCPSPLAGRWGRVLPPLLRATPPGTRLRARPPRARPSGRPGTGRRGSHDDAPRCSEEPPRGSQSSRSVPRPARGARGAAAPRPRRRPLPLASPTAAALTGAPRHRPVVSTRIHLAIPDAECFSCARWACVRLLSKNVYAALKNVFCRRRSSSHVLEIHPFPDARLADSSSGPRLPSPLAGASSLHSTRFQSFQTATALTAVWYQ